MQIVSVRMIRFKNLFLEVTPKLHDLALWMAPTRSMQSYTHEAVSSLMPILKTHVEGAATLPPELITSLRILQYLTLPSKIFFFTDLFHSVFYLFF